MLGALLGAWIALHVGSWAVLTQVVGVPTSITMMLAVRGLFLDAKASRPHWCLVLIVCIGAWAVLCVDGRTDLPTAGQMGGIILLWAALLAFKGFTERSGHADTGVGA
ncbi:MAG TPA: hypothetical protein VKV02_01510 [Acidobacteriaceae bacterium]|nr:hypothetical protein [Acidobacteriaceae bacterium]